jgi:2-methylaconitate cis-trans-isomerase PrpF
VRPGGSRTGRLLPTGRTVDVISSDTVEGFSGEPIRATIMDCGNPCVFIQAYDLDLDPSILPQELEKDGEKLKLLEDIRRAALVLIGLSPTMSDAAETQSIPKVCIVGRPTTHKLISGETLGAESADLVVRTISSGDPHRAIPITAALCVATAAQVNGTLLESLFGCSAGANRGKELVIGHPSGTIAVQAEVEQLSDGVWEAISAGVIRTARKLFDGTVYWDGPRPPLP